MKRTIQTFLLATCVLVFASVANAQSRTWVSGVGDDLNPCSRTAPCKTYAGAISKTSKDGEISTLDPGGFGAVTITKSIYINGTHGAGYGSILNSNTTGVTINITDVNDVRKAVRLRGLDINGVSVGINGVSILAANNVWIEDSVIDGNAGNGTTTGIGIRMDDANGCNLYVSDTVIHKNVTGVRVRTTAGFGVANLKNCNIEGNTTGLDVNTNGFVTIEGSRISSNTGDGVKTSAGSTNLNVQGCTLTNNGGIAINAAAASTVRALSNVIVDNGTGFGGTTAVIRTDGQNRNANAVPGAPGGGLVTIH